MKFADALIALDRAVVAVSQATACHTYQRQSWTAAADAIERFARGQVVYFLSDGRTRLTYSIADRWCMLDIDADYRVRNNFEDAVPERRALERLVAESFDTQRAD